MKWILLTTALLTLLSCSETSKATEKQLSQKKIEVAQNEEETIAEKQLEELMATLSVGEETFQVSTSSDTTLICRKGTKIVLPKDALVFKDGSKVNGSVEIRVKECYQLSDFIAEGLQTSTPEHMLETAGMVHVSAWSKGKEVTIAEGKSYEIQIPKNGSEKSGMQAFYGNEPQNGIVDWTIAPTPLNTTTSSAFASESSSASVSSSFTSRFPSGNPNELKGGEIVRSRKIFAEKRKGIHVPWGKTMTQWKLDTGDGQTMFSYIEENFKPSDEMVQDFYMKHRTPIYELKFDEKGKVNSMKVIYSAGKENDRAIADFLATVPPLSKEERDDPRVHEFYQIVFAQKLVKEKVSAEEYIEYLSQDVDMSSSTVLDFYVLSLSKFGWINCDRFRDKKYEKMDFFVNVPNPKGTSVQLVFKEYKSCMHATFEDDGFVFRNIPKGTEVKVIAIRKGKDSARMSVQEGNTADREMLLLDFTSFTLMELRDALNSI